MTIYLSTGLFQKGKQHEDLLKDLNGTWKKGYVFGKLINIGFGSDYGYPGLKLEKGGSKIFGMVFQSKNLEKKLLKIDEFEGENYKRIISKIFLDDSSEIMAYLYELKQLN